MHRTTFHISQMDCPAEEQLVRMRLEPMADVEQLKFDLVARKLTVVHQGDLAPIAKAVASLKLGDKLVATEAAEPSAVADNCATQRRMLWWVLAINASFFFIEFGFGWLAKSMGLIADSLDMLADASVYALSLIAVGGTITRKKRVAAISGYLQLGLAALGFTEVLRRVFFVDELPEFKVMIVIATCALVANAVCLWLLARTRSEEAHMQASQIFTSNDIIINAGVIFSGMLVYYSDSRWPDLIIGSIVFVIVLQGALRILRLAKE